MRAARAPADPLSLLGTTLEGKYRVDALVAEGGFGVVYRGFHLALAQPIALKCLKIPPHFTAEAREIFTARFREEGKLLHRLSASHLSVVRVLDAGVLAAPGGAALPFLVLEWLEGRPLDHLLAERRAAGAPPLSGAEALALLRPAVAALAVAHEQGIAHRDVKPGNLFVLAGGGLKVIDFGIAKAMAEGERATELATHTSSGFHAFSPRYGAPEQFRSRLHGPTGPWTDVHALGLCLVEMVTGAPAYPGSEAGDFFEAATSELRPTPRARGAVVSDGFEALCARALRRSPAERFADAGELLQALDAVLGPEPPRAALPAAPPSPPPLEPDRAPGAPGTPADGPATTRPAPPRRGRAYAFAAASSLLIGLGAVLAARLPARPAAALPDRGEPAAPPEAPAEPPNRWVRISPPAGRVVLGIASDTAPESVKGFRPARGIVAPADPFDLQEHEVTWAELEPLLALHPELDFPRPADVPDDPRLRARLPASGVPWETARRACQIAGGALPTEEQWEYAARGEARRRAAWGDAPLDPRRTRAHGGPSAALVPVMISVQDVTPGGPGQALFDLMGNVQEWTLGLYREGRPGEPEDWADEGGVTYRAVRGLPPTGDPGDVPREPAAYRDALCATGPCPPDTEAARRTVGFRCARAVLGRGDAR